MPHLFHECQEEQNFRTGSIRLGSFLLGVAMKIGVVTKTPSF